MAEMFKVYKNLSPAIIADLSHVRQNNYNLRHASYFAILHDRGRYHTERNYASVMEGLRKKLKSESLRSLQSLRNLRSLLPTAAM